MKKRRVYLVNLCFGIAGIEKRFVNILFNLHKRGAVDPVLIIPDEHKTELKHSKLIPDEIEDRIIDVSQSRIGRIPAQYMKRFKVRGYGKWKEYFAAKEFNKEIKKVTKIDSPVMHFGITSRFVKIPKTSNVFECVDSTLVSLNSALWRAIVQEKCIVNCQTDRIRYALESHWPRRSCHTLTAPLIFANNVAKNKNIKRDSRKIIFVGRLSKEKSPLLFIEALRILRDRNIRFTASILGEGPLESELKKRIKQYNLERIVTLMFDSNVGDHLLSSSIFVSLQTGDNYPSQALLEAMTAGCAVIASDVGETHRFVDSSNGLRVQLDPNEIANCLILLLSDARMTNVMGKKSIEKTIEKFSANKYCEYLEEMYNLSLGSSLLSVGQ